MMRFGLFTIAFLSSLVFSANVDSLSRDICPYFTLLFKFGGIRKAVTSLTSQTPVISAVKSYFECLSTPPKKRNYKPCMCDAIAYALFPHVPHHQTFGTRRISLSDIHEIICKTMKDEDVNADLNIFQKMRIQQRIHKVNLWSDPIYSHSLSLSPHDGYMALVNLGREPQRPEIKENEQKPAETTDEIYFIQIPQILLIFPSHETIIKVPQHLDITERKVVIEQVKEQSWKIQVDDAIKGEYELYGMIKGKNMVYFKSLSADNSWEKVGTFQDLGFESDFRLLVYVRTSDIAMIVDDGSGLKDKSHKLGRIDGGILAIIIFSVLVFVSLTITFLVMWHKRYRTKYEEEKIVSRPFSQRKV